MFRFLVRLGKIVEVVNGFEEETSLQNIVYFWEQLAHSDEFELDYHFKWDSHGPYSPKLSEHIRRAIILDFLKKVLVKNKSLVNASLPPKILYKPAANLQRFEKKYTLTKSEQHALNRLAQFCEGRSSRELELLAAIHYFLHEISSLSHDMDLLKDVKTIVFEKIDSYKPKGFNKAEKETAWNYLKTCEFVGI